MGRTCDLAALARAGFVDEVILAGPHDREKALRVLRTAQQLRLRREDGHRISLASSREKQSGSGTFLSFPCHEERLPLAGLFLKRALDVAGARSGAYPRSPSAGPPRNSDQNWTRPGPCSIPRCGRDARGGRSAATSSAPWFGMQKL